MEQKVQDRNGRRPVDSQWLPNPPYEISLDSEWRDRAGINQAGPAEPSYMKHRTEGHTQTTVSGDTISQIGRMPSS